MKKFLAYIRIGIVDGLMFRFQLAYWLYINMIPLLGLFYLWTTVYEGKIHIGPYTLEMMITYYILTKLINRFTTTYSEIQIAKDIRDGQLNQYITRPLRYAVLKFGERLGIRIVNAALFIPLYAIIIVLLQQYFIGPSGGIAMLQITGNILLSILSYFFLARILGGAAFFMLETHALFGLKDNVISLLSGYMFPLFLFPDFVEKILLWTPFPYYYYFPMQIYFGLLKPIEITNGFVIQTLWVAILFFISELMWHKGMKNYEAVGV